MALTHPMEPPANGSRKSEKAKLNTSSSNDVMPISTQHSDGQVDGKVPTDTPDPAMSASADSRMPSQEEIASLAYQLWEEGGRQENSSEANWHHAEQNLLAPKQSQNC